MNKGVVIIYVFWSLILISAGIYIVRNMTDLSNPILFGSSMERFKETVDEYSDVP